MNATQKAIMREEVRRATSAEHDTIEAAVCQAGGLRDVERHFSASTLNRAQDHYHGRISLREVLCEYANKYGGLCCSPKDDVEPVIRAAFRPAEPGVTGAPSSDSHFGSLLANVANKFLVGGFESVESTWRRVAAVRPSRDFKPLQSYRLTDSFTFEPVGASGEVRELGSGLTTAAGYPNQLLTYARLWKIPYRDLVNDDLGAVTLIPYLIGRGGALTLNRVFWTAFAAGSAAFFTAGNNNLLTGGPSALNDAGLTAAEAALLAQTAPDGQPLDLAPFLLLVPTALRRTAFKLMHDSNFFDPTLGRWQGAYGAAASAYLGSATAWYLLADPAVAATMGVAFLGDRQAPTVVSAGLDAAFNSLAVIMRGHFDFGVAFEEARAGVKSAGA